MNIGIVNDMPMALEALRRAVVSSGEHRVLWAAHDGAEAVELCAREVPDLVLMDLIMPKVDGVEATRRIMAATPCAILVVTASVGANAPRVFEAMGHGALDAVDTPSLGGSDAQQGMAALLAKIDTIRRLIGDRNPVRAGDQALSAPAEQPVQKLVAIGASAGGPAALAVVLRGLPRDFPAALVIIQHVDAQFAAGMAAWLSQDSPIPVGVAKEGDRPVGGAALIAASSDHLVFKDADRLGYTAEPREHVYRPSVDVFFDSVERLWRGAAIGVVLTGMGRDGAAGLKQLRTKGHHTIAQDRASSAVYGMPKAAAALDAAVEIVPLEQIAPRLLAVASRKP